MVQISNNVFFIHFSFLSFLDELFFFIEFDLKASNSWKFELVLHIGLFNIVNHNQINQVTKLLLFHQLFLSDEVHQ